MTNDELVLESKRIKRDEYSLWFEFINAEDGLVETIKEAVDDKSKSERYGISIFSYRYHIISDHIISVILGLIWHFCAEYSSVLAKT